MEQLVKEPTRGDSFLDLTLVNNPNLVEEVKVIPGMSDHKAVYGRHLTSMQRGSKSLPERSSRGVNIDHIKRDMKTVSNEYKTTPGTTVQEKWDKFETKL